MRVQSFSRPRFITLATVIPIDRTCANSQTRSSRLLNPSQTVSVCNSAAYRNSQFSHSAYGYPLMANPQVMYPIMHPQMPRVYTAQVDVSEDSSDDDLPLATILKKATTSSLDRKGRSKTSMNHEVKSRPVKSPTLQPLNHQKEHIADGPSLNPCSSSRKSSHPPRQRKKHEKEVERVADDTQSLDIQVKNNDPIMSAHLSDTSDTTLQVDAYSIVRKNTHASLHDDCPSKCIPTEPVTQVPQKPKLKKDKHARKPKESSKTAKNDPPTKPKLTWPSLHKMFKIGDPHKTATTQAVTY